MLNFIFDNPSLYLENHLLEKYRKGKKSLLKAGLRIWRISRLVTDWRNIETNARNRKAGLSNFSKLSKKIKYSESTCVSLQYSLRYYWLLYLVRCLLTDKFPQLSFIPRFCHNQRSLKLPLGKRNSFIAVGCKWWYYRILGFRAEYKNLFYTVCSASVCPCRITSKPIKMWYTNIIFKIKALNDSFSKRFNCRGPINYKTLLNLGLLLICSLRNIMKIHKLNCEWLKISKIDLN